MIRLIEFRFWAAGHSLVTGVSICRYIYDPAYKSHSYEDSLHWTVQFVSLSHEKVKTKSMWWFSVRRSYYMFCYCNLWTLKFNKISNYYSIQRPIVCVMMWWSSALIATLSNHIKLHSTKSNAKSENIDFPTCFTNFDPLNPFGHLSCYYVCSKQITIYSNELIWFLFCCCFCTIRLTIFAIIWSFGVPFFLSRIN